ncbi:MAG TPA: hypothetical protein VFR14_10820 [Candidatus Limnocylindrales bacterium]|nr:hypothetical protein [Candidatus Limnocylindrales bacterium]
MRRLTAMLVAAVIAAGCASAPSPSPSPTPSPSPSGAVVCPIANQSGRLPSDRLLSADVESTTVADRITFRFGPPSGVIAASEGVLREVRPPFFEGGSGEEVTVAGDRFLEVRFEGLLLYDENGTPTYEGERDRRLDLPAIVEVAVTEEFEGYMTWIVGVRGPGCVSLGADPGGIVTLDVLHG